MLAMVLRALKEPLRTEDIPTPVAGSGEVLVRVVACGIDGTDLKLLDGFGYVPDLPFVMGHEPAGIVAETGSGVTDFRPGDRVVPYTFFTCGQCPLCRANRQQLCANLAGILGVLGKAGGYAEYLSVPARQLVRIPDGVDWADAAVCCDAGITAFHAVDRADVSLGETVAVFGMGGVGSVVTQLAHAAGARVIAIVRSAARAERARDMGADEVVTSSEESVPAAIRALTHGLGADRVLDCVGSEETLTQSVESLRRGGRLVIVGYTPDRYPLAGKQVAQNELEVVGTRCGRMQDLVSVLDLVARCKVRSVVTDRYPLEQANEALEYLRAGRARGRVVLVTPFGRKTEARAGAGAL